MRKSVRLYISQWDIDNSECGNKFACVVKVAMARQGILKGKCSGVVAEGVFVGPNRKTIDNWCDEDKTPQLLFTKNGTEFVESFDISKSNVQPTHITIIDPTGSYL